MNPRELIKTVAATVGATIAMPQGAFAKLEEVTDSSELDFFSLAQREQVAMLAEAIIPETDTPGAVEAGVPLFIEAIVKDCYRAPQQKMILEGLADYTARCQAQSGKVLSQLSEDEQVSFLILMDRDTRREMLEAMKLDGIRAYNSVPVMGKSIHEMGTARMGSTPQESVLNSHNQVWGALNVFCTDGAAMISSGCQNPSLTYMALTARAADYAVNEMKKGHL